MPFWLLMRVEEDAHVAGMHDILLDDDVGGMIVADGLVSSPPACLCLSPTHALDGDLVLWLVSRQRRQVGGGAASENAKV